MSTLRIDTRAQVWTGIFSAAVLAAAPAMALAAGNTAATVQRVQVLPDRYVAGGKRFADVDNLDQWVRSSGARSLQFHACMWSANERLAAAIERLQYVYLDVRWTAAGKAGCPAVAGDAADRKP